MNSDGSILRNKSKENIRDLAEILTSRPSEY